MKTLLRNQPPKPTQENPHLQLDWLVERFVRRYCSKSTKLTYRTVMQAYKKFLKACNGYDERLAADPRFFISVHCDAFMLHNAAHYWRQQSHAPLTVAGRIRNLRQILDYAMDEKLVPVTTYLMPDITGAKRATLQRAAYEDPELSFIFETFAPVFQHARQIVKGYRPTGVGRDTRRELDPLISKPGIPSHRGWEEWDNIVWYFENRLGSIPIRQRLNNQHQEFFGACKNHHGGTLEVYRRLGVTPVIAIRFIAPLAMKLSWETGLNTEVLLGLKRDCLVDSHPLTNLPYIRYYKARSTGEKDLHLELFDPNQVSLTLEYKQSVVIRNTIQLILDLTEPLVSMASNEDKSMLFLYESWRINGKVCRLSVKNFAQWARVFLANARSQDKVGVPSCLNLGRFRPTKITQLVRQGRDFFEIQAIAGHKTACSTLKYVASHHIAPQAQREVSRALRRIHENIDEFQQNPRPYATENTQHSDGVIYKGVLCDCKNVFDPPTSVRRLPTYKENDACTYFNMCLLCPNAVITKQNLPRLIAYKQEIELALSNNTSSAPNSAHYEKALAVINGILLEFSELDRQWAKDLAETRDYYSDPFTYQAVS